MRLVLGIVSGTLLAALVAAGVVAVPALNQREEVRRGWNLVEVARVEKALEAGDVLAAEDLSVLALPEQFVVPSMLRPTEAQGLVGRSVSVPLDSGDVLTWQDFAPRLDAARLDDCVKAVAQAVAEASTPVLADTADQFIRDAIVPATVEPLPDASRKPGQVVEVVVVTEDLEIGTVLTLRQLAVEKWPGDLFTASHVRATELKALPAAKVTVPLLKGDPVLWQFIDRARGPLTLAGCEVAVLEARKRVQDEVVPAVAKRWLEQHP